MDEIARDLRRTDAYRYELPPELIAKSPADPPDSSRLMNLGPGERTHLHFVDFPSLLCAGDVLVVNETRVVRARLHGSRVPGGGAAELLLLRPADCEKFSFDSRRWLALARPGRRLLAGRRIRFGEDGFCEIAAVRSDGIREIDFHLNVSLEALLERHGEMPLPPYVGVGDAERAARYQTIFARVPGSVAAPTASLHFTAGVLETIRAKGVTIVPLVLDIGLGTFKPMETEYLDDHVMHAERFSVPQESAVAVNHARNQGGRVVAAGTTVLRALETAGSSGEVLAGEGETALFVTPGHPFRIVDALLTNFHLPASTLLVLVTVFGGYDTVIAAYAEAASAGYRFYSFGDAMFVRRSGRPG